MEEIDPKDPTTLKNVLAALNKSENVKHWRYSSLEFEPDTSEYLEYNRNDLTDPGDLSKVFFTDEFAFGEPSQLDDSEEADGAHPDDQQNCLDNLPTSAVISHQWMDPAEVTKEKDKNPSLLLAERARQQKLLLDKMEDMKLDAELKEIKERNMLIHYERYLSGLRKIKEQKQQELERYCNQRDQDNEAEESRLRKLEEENQQTLQQQEQKYSQYIRHQSIELSKLIEDAEKKEAEQRNRILGIVNELHTMRASFVDKHDQIKILIQELNADPSIDASIQDLRENTIEPLDKALQTVEREAELLEVKANLQKNIKYMIEIVQILEQKKEEKMKLEAEQASQLAAQAKQEESQALLKAEQEKQVLVQQQEAAKANAAAGSSEDHYQALVLSGTIKRFEELKTKMVDYLNVQNSLDSEKRRDVSRVLIITSQVHCTDHNVNKKLLEKILGYLGGRSIQHNSKQYCTNNDPVVTAFVKFKLIKDLIKAGIDADVQGAGSAAYAWFIVSVIAAHPDIWEMFLYHIYSYCPYLVPLYIFQKTGQSEEDFDKERGKLPKEANDNYTSRMGKAALLFGLVLVKMFRRKDLPIPVQSPVIGWKLLAELVTIDPAPDVSSHVICYTLATIGTELECIYGKQFGKLMAFLVTSYWDRVCEISSLSAQSKLKNVLEDYQKNRKLTPFEHLNKFD